MKKPNIEIKSKNGIKIPITVELMKSCTQASRNINRNYTYVFENNETAYNCFLRIKDILKEKKISHTISNFSDRKTEIKLHYNNSKITMRLKKTR